MEKLFIFCVGFVALAVSPALAQKDMTGVEPLSDDAIVPEPINHDPVADAAASNRIWTFFEVPLEEAWYVNQAGSVVGRNGSSFYRWKPSQSVQFLSPIPDVEGYYGVLINRAGNIVTWSGLNNGNDTVEYFSEGEPVGTVVSSAFDVVGLDDLGTLWYYKKTNEQFSFYSVVGESLLNGGVDYTPFVRDSTRTFNPPSVSESGEVYGSYLTYENSETFYVLNDEVTGIKQWPIDGPPEIGYKVEDVNSWGVALGNDGIYFRDGTVEPLPNVEGSGFFWEIDELGNIRGGVSSGRTRNVWKAVRDEDGNFLSYELEDYIPAPVPEGWTTNMIIAPSEIMPQLGSATRGGVESEILLMPLAFDIDVDSDNDGLIDRSLAEEESEDPLESSPGQGLRGNISYINDGDADYDGVPDFADGMTIFESDGVRHDAFEKKAESGQLVPITIEFAEVGDLAVAFYYEGSDPALVDRNELPDGTVTYAPAPGRMRLWTGDGVAIRSVLPVDQQGGNYIAPGVFYTREQLGFEVDEATTTIYAEAILASDGDATDTITMGIANIPPAGLGALQDAEETDVVAFTFLEKPKLVTDYNRDGRIDEADFDASAQGKVFYFWINDDDDVDAVEGNDIPFLDNAEVLDPAYAGHKAARASEKLDHENDVVDGMRDLEDFFPIAIDVGDLLDGVEASRISVNLSGAPVSVIDPSKTGWINPLESGKHLRELSFAEGLINAPVLKAAVGEALELSPSFVLQLKNHDGRGVLLLEGIEKTDTFVPLTFTLEIDGTVALQPEMLVKICPVETMFRHINLTAEATYDEENNKGVLVGRTGRKEIDEEKWFDSSVEKRFVYLHGYNINNGQSRGEHSNMFKRLYQMGLKSGFTGVTWFGWRDQKRWAVDLLGWETYKCPNYYGNVINAFKSSRGLKEAIDEEGYKDFVIGAHSLGNMVVSSAICDWDLKPKDYFMFNAAVAREAFDVTSVDLNTRVNMSARSWAKDLDDFNNDRRHYGTRLWASDWFRLFESDESRSEVTWIERFGDITQKTRVHNYYSSTENVLSNGDGKGFLLVSLPDAWAIWNGSGAFYAQEVGKGTSLTGNLLVQSSADVRSHGGWGFSKSNYRYDPRGKTYKRVWPMSRANETGSITDEDLRARPFFGEFDEEDDAFSLPFLLENPYSFQGSIMYDDESGSEYEALEDDELYIVRAKLLAEAIPAVSYAVGRNTVDKFDEQPGEETNRDMSKEFRDEKNWPTRERGGDDAWRHGDLHKISLVYIHEVYEELLKEGLL